MAGQEREERFELELAGGTSGLVDQFIDEPEQEVLDRVKVVIERRASDSCPLDQVPYGGPVVSVTLSEAIPRHVPAFLRASRPVEQQALESDGLLWTMGFFKPPMSFSTITMWSSAEATDAFAYSDDGSGAHRTAMPLVHDWFRRSTTMRFRPNDVKGSLSGDLALPSALLSP